MQVSRWKNWTAELTTAQKKDAEKVKSLEVKPRADGMRKFNNINVSPRLLSADQSSLTL